MLGNSPPSIILWKVSFNDLERTHSAMVGGLYFSTNKNSSFK
jgi:hypothetical protein